MGAMRFVGWGFGIAGPSAVMGHWAWAGQARARALFDASGVWSR